MITKALRWLPQTVMGAGIGLILAMSYPMQLQAYQPPAPTADGDLAVAVRTANALSGSYGLAGSLVEFTADRAGPDQAGIRINVNGVVLAATVDYAKRSGSWIGDGQILGTNGKTALTGMERALAKRLRPGKDALGPHEALLYRAVSYWSEAPAGLVLTGDSFEGPTESDSPKGATGTPVEQECLNPMTGEQSVLACQESNEDGVWYTACSGSAVECHDANGHCFQCTWTTIGKAVNCKGRCGGGCCIPDGLGVYTYDCLDHDSCCAEHGGCFNPWDGECGDEYGEADDDFWLGRDNCGWQC